MYKTNTAIQVISTNTYPDLTSLYCVWKLIYENVISLKKWQEVKIFKNQQTDIPLNEEWAFQETHCNLAPRFLHQAVQFLFFQDCSKLGGSHSEYTKLLAAWKFSIWIVAPIDTYIYHFMLYEYLCLIFYICLIVTVVIVSIRICTVVQTPVEDLSLHDFAF